MTPRIEAAPIEGQLKLEEYCPGARILRWHLEYSKFPGEENIPPRQRQRRWQIGQTLVNAAGRTAYVETDDLNDKDILLHHELRRRGISVIGLHYAGRNGLIWVYAASFILATAGLAYTLVRSLFERNGDLPESGVVGAIHGEISNRTKHVLEAWKSAESTAPLLILGRPRAALATLAERLRSECGVSVPVIRPFNTLDLLVVTLRLPRIFWEGWGIRKAEHRDATVVELAGAVYRVILGDAMAGWQAKQQYCALHCIYGHTGLGDTTALEVAQQIRGCVTVHWLHGMTNGYLWDGVSSLGLFRSRADADWHDQFSQYARTAWIGGEQPAYVGGESGILLYSNLLHPMNLTFRRSGAEQFRLMISFVARAVERGFTSRHCVHWKPHPLFDQFDSDLRVAATEYVRRQGVRRVSQQAAQMLSQTCLFVLTTPSSVALDLLRQGRMPILILNGPLPAGSSLARLPLVATDEESLRIALDQVSKTGEELYKQAWLDIGPGLAPSLHDPTRSSVQ